MFILFGMIFQLHMNNNIENNKNPRHIVLFDFNEIPKYVNIYVDNMK